MLTEKLVAGIYSQDLRLPGRLYVGADKSLVRDINKAKLFNPEEKSLANEEVKAYSNFNFLMEVFAYG